MLPVEARKKQGLFEKEGPVYTCFASFTYLAI